MTSREAQENTGRVEEIKSKVKGSYSRMIANCFAGGGKLGGKQKKVSGRG